MMALTHGRPDAAEFLKENFGEGSSGKIFRVVSGTNEAFAIEELAKPSLPSDAIEKTDAERIEKNDHAPLHVAFQEDERQLVLMSLAQLAISLPGFDLALAKTADHMQGHKMFTAFKKFRRRVIADRAGAAAQTPKEEGQS